MGKKHLRYRVGIDVGLYSVGLAAIEIDDSSDNPYDAMPIDFLSIMSVIHDGGIDPSGQKNAESRKSISGARRRARNLFKRRRKLLRSLDDKLLEYGYPVDEAIRLTTTFEQQDPYIAWRARIRLVEGYIENNRERKLALAIAVRHIARHRGWRNSYSSFDSLKDVTQDSLRFYQEFLGRANAWRSENELPEIPISDSFTPTVAQVIEPLLSSEPHNRFRRADKDDMVLARIGKLHQSTYYHELKLIFDTQKVPDEEQEDISRLVFLVKNPKDVGAASALVGFDDLQPGKRRASKASIAFQEYRILATIANLRIKESSVSRELSIDERKRVFDFLTSPEVSKNRDDVTWHDVAEQIGISRNMLSGIGGSTQDGMPVSSQTPPTLSTEAAIISLPKSLNLIKEWWAASSPMEKEMLIEVLGNAGIQEKGLSKDASEALDEVRSLLERLGGLDEKALADLDKINLAPGRAAYSVDTLVRLNRRMYEEGMNLHEARKAEFGVGDDWHPSANKLGTPTGNPAVDRTIKIVSRWLMACESKWGKPETVNIEHVREGFMSEKQYREYRRDVDARYRANKTAREEIAQNADVRGEGLILDVEGMNRNDTRRLQAIQRQNCQCLYCGAKINYSTAQMDHIVPRKGPGSSNAISNLVATCASCNASKNKELFSKWASPERMQETVERVNGMLRDSYFSSEKRFSDFKKDVISRLKRTEEDPPLDSRSMESVAWMARELREQISGHFGYGALGQIAPSDGEELLQRVQVFRGSITSEARKASGIEGRLPWLGGQEAKTRLDRRHHAVDAAVIAMLRPSVAKTLSERDALHREQQVLGRQTVGEKWNAWKDYQGACWGDRAIYLHWRDEQMERLLVVLHAAMENNRIVVSRPLRLRLELGKAHEDTVFPMTFRKVGDCLSATAIDKASSPALWLALTNHPDYSEEEGLPEDMNRTIRVQGITLPADSKISFLSKPKDDLDSFQSAVYAPVRGGMAGIGEAIHHARFYRIPKINAKGERKGWKYSMVRVFQVDLLGHGRENLFEVPLPPQSISIRSSKKDIRDALSRGEAEYLGWAIVDQEVIIRPESSKTFSKNGTSKTSSLLRLFPSCSHYTVKGFSTNSKILLAPLLLSPEGASDLAHQDADALEKAKLVIERGVPLEVNPVLASEPLFVHRNTLGFIRWKSNNHMPTCWTVPQD